ncbi:MAG: sigma-E factor regulatory protein RseB domain-containing protein, partial [Candidatus Sericytochromatia bacterium]
APKSQLVRVLPIEPKLGPKQRLALLGRNYRFQVLGQARRANRPVVLTRFHPRHAGNMSHMLWIDHETGLPLAVERRETGGALVDRSEYTRIEFSPVITENLFRFVIPDGCRVASAMTVLARGEAGHAPRGLSFEPKAPQALPAGYAPLNWQYFKSGREVPTFAWRYHDGLSTLSLFAVDARHRAPMPKGAKVVGLKEGQGYVLSQGGERMLCWSRDAVAYTLVGHLPEAELVKVADSVM